ncbi:MAG TPA: hypothetical protein VMS17_33195 [Gemmataceae bacterium]|nr:hypothetical protein [Gemmataceae bacterium]
MGHLVDRTKDLGLTTELSATRPVRFIPHAGSDALQTIRCGILFIMAFWSGPARVAFAALKEMLMRVDPQGRLELIVVDTDACPELYDLPEFSGNLHGKGEAAWVKDGKIVCTAFGWNPTTFETNTAGLLAKCSA